MGKLRAVAALVALVAAFLPATMAAADNTPQFTLAVQSGYGGSSPSGGWVPVQVDVTNHGPDTRATLKISVTASGNGYSGPGIKGIPIPFPSPGPGGFAFGAPGPAPGNQQQGSSFTEQQSVVLPAGSTKHFTAYLPAYSGTARGEVVSTSGKSLAASEAQLSVANQGLAVAVVSDSSAALNQIGAIVSLNQTFSSQPQIVHIAPALLPDNAAALTGFGLVAFANATTDSLTPAQRRALDDYVGQGGTVLVAGGSTWHKTLAGLPADLVLVAPTAVATLPGLPGLSSALGTVVASGAVDVATGTRRSGITDFSEGQVPILIEAPLGRGEVMFSAPDLSAEPLASWSGSLPLLRQILVRAVAGTTSSQSLGSAVSGRGIQAKGSSIFQALANIPSLDLPSPALIAVALVVFIFLVGPVNYFVLRRMRRPDLAWGTIPLLVVLSAGSIYGIGIKTRGTDVLADRIRVVYLRNGSDRAYVNAGTGVFAPHSGTHTVSTVEGSLVTGLSGGSQFFLGGAMNIPFPFAPSGPSGSFTIVDGAPPAVLLNWPNADSIQAFGEEYAETEPGRLEAHLTVVNGRITGTVVNHLQTTVTDAVVISGTAYSTFGAIRPGGSITVDIPLPSAGSASLIGPVSTLAQQIYLHAPAACGNGPCNVSTFQSSRPTARQRQAQRRSDVLNGIMAQSTFNASTPTLVAWTSGPAAPLSPVRVDGHVAQLNELDAYVLPLEPALAGTALPAGAVQARVVDATASIPSKLGFPVGMGAFLPPNSQTTSEFELGKGDWSRLTLTDTTPTGGPAFPGSVTSAVFNFKTSAWDQITLGPSQPVDIASPADHVSPDGAVRVRRQTGQAPALGGTLDISGDRVTA